MTNANPTSLDAARVKTHPVGHHGGGCDGLNHGARVVPFAAALLVMITGLATAPASGAQNIAPADRAHFDPAPCPKPNLPGSQPDPLDSDPAYSCGYLTVPVDRARPAGPRLKIAVARVKAVSPNLKPDPIVYLTGGPGVSGLIRARRSSKTGV